MDPETSKRISELAANLKKLHLAATMEEAHQRAKEMILGENVDKPIQDVVKDKSISELHDELKERVDRLDSTSDASMDQAGRIDASLDRVKEALHEDSRRHDIEKEDLKGLKEDVDDAKRRKDELKDIVEEADYVQEHSKEENQ